MQTPVNKGVFLDASQAALQGSVATPARDDAGVRTIGLLLSEAALRRQRTAGDQRGSPSRLRTGAARAYLIDEQAKIIAGILPIPFSMRSMRPTYGRPITILSAYVGAQLIRRLGSPCRVAGANPPGSVSRLLVELDDGRFKLRRRNLAY